MDASALRGLEGEWRALAESRGNAFLTPEWFFSWHRHYGDRAEPAVTALRDRDGRLSGVLPLTISTSGRPRAVQFAASGLGDHFHPASPPALESMVASAAGRALFGHPRRWSTIVLENVDVGSGWWRALTDSSPVRLSSGSHARSVLPYARIAGCSWDEYLAARSRGFRSQLRRKMRALEDDHDVAFRRTDRAADVASDLSTLFRLHDARWAARPGVSSLSGDRPRAFHSDFAAAAFERGWLRLWFLNVDGVPVAAWYGWRIGERCAYYQAGLDPAFASYSVGFLLMAQAIKAAIEEGAGEFDMLLGDEAFKSRFADHRREVRTIVITRARHPARLLAASERALRHTARRMPERLRGPARRAARRFTRRLPGARRR